MLVGITSFGDKNIDFLKRVVANYRSMTAFEVDVVVFSDAPKSVSEHVRVVTGLPSKNPWSLGFAHKEFFAREVENYDLFLYSEEDILFNERNIEAFLRITPELPDDEIAGFMHYEQDTAGKIWMVNVHRHFHWKAESVRSRNGLTLAEFTNQHSACYLLTQAQLKRAIQSGGYLRKPYRRQYDMLCTAATDPYTGCGLRKVIAINQLDDFLVHHLPNRYVTELNVSLADFKDQIQTLVAINEGTHPASSLCEVTVGPDTFEWSKSYYEPSDESMIKLVPPAAAEVLSIGCGWGATEEALVERGASVTALPLDSVIGAVAAKRGINVVYGNLAEGLKQLGSRTFDVVIMGNLVHLVGDPMDLISEVVQLCRAGGRLLLSGPNFDYFPVLAQRARRTFGQNQASERIRLDVATLVAKVIASGCDVELFAWQNFTPADSLSGSVRSRGWLKQMAYDLWRMGRSSALCEISGSECNAAAVRAARNPVRRLCARHWVLKAHRRMSENPRQQLAPERAYELQRS